MHPAWSGSLRGASARPHHPFAGSESDAALPPCAPSMGRDETELKLGGVLTTRGSFGLCVSIEVMALTTSQCLRASSVLAEEPLAWGPIANFSYMLLFHTAYSI